MAPLSRFATALPTLTRGASQEAAGTWRGEGLPPVILSVAQPPPAVILSGASRRAGSVRRSRLCQRSRKIFFFDSPGFMIPRLPSGRQPLSVSLFCTARRASRPASIYICFVISFKSSTKRPCSAVRGFPRRRMQPKRMSRCPLRGTAVMRSSA